MTVARPTHCSSKNHSLQAVRAPLHSQHGQAAIEAVLLTLLLALAVFSLLEDSPLSQLIAAINEHQARMARGLTLP